jgi:RHS repeat-associated protein
MNSLIGGGSISFTYADAGQSDRLTAGSVNFFNSLTGVTSATYGGNTYYYTRDANGTVMGMRVAGGASYYYTTDNQGSIIAMTSTLGVIDATYSYDPYGNTTIGTNVSGLADTNRWRYAGGWFDSPEKMYHFGARYYAPTIGRFLQLDPSSQSKGYSYTGDEPVNGTDPSGTESIADGCADSVSFTVGSAVVVSTAGGSPELGAADIVGSCLYGALAASIGGELGSVLSDYGILNDVANTLSDLSDLL